MGIGRRDERDAGTKLGFGRSLEMASRNVADLDTVKQSKAVGGPPSRRLKWRMWRRRRKEEEEEEEEEG
jgi:hypothetical protein